MKTPSTIGHIDQFFFILKIYRTLGKVSSKSPFSKEIYSKKLLELIQSLFYVCICNFFVAINKNNSCCFLHKDHTFGWNIYAVQANAAYLFFKKEKERHKCNVYQSHSKISYHK